MFRDATAAVAGEAQPAVLDIAQLTARSILSSDVKTESAPIR
jgi:hypothetical protein